MKNDLFEKAKQAVAKKHSFENWPTLNLEMRLHGEPWQLDDCIQEVAELYARWVANKAVKDERIVFQNDPKRWFLVYSDESIGITDAFKKKPLPFPQQPDGR